MKWIIDLINLKILKKPREERRWEPEPIYITPPERGPFENSEEEEEEDKKVIIIDM